MIYKKVLDGESEDIGGMKRSWLISIDSALGVRCESFWLHACRMLSTGLCLYFILQQATKVAYYFMNKIGENKVS